MRNTCAHSLADSIGVDVKRGVPGKQTHSEPGFEFDLDLHSQDLLLLARLGRANPTPTFHRPELLLQRERN